jgi:hypothetical protein
MGLKRNVDKNSGPIMSQNSLSIKRESRNPPQTICEFRKIHRGGNSIPCMAPIALRAILGPSLATATPT